MKETKASGVSVIATIATFRDIHRQATDLKTYLTNSELKYLPSWLRNLLEPGINRYDHYTPEDKKVLEASLAFQKKLILAFQRGGIPLMTGTDATAIGPVAGFSIHEELLEFVNSGLTPMQALRAATVNPAMYLRSEKDYGTIETGKKADFALLSADPLTDIRNTRKIRGVMAHGLWYDSKALAKMRDEIPGKYREELKSMIALMQKEPRAAIATLAKTDPMNRLSPAVLTEIAMQRGIEAWRKAIVGLRAVDPKFRVVSQESVNNLGYTLLGKKLNSEAIEVFLQNTQDFPTSANTFDSLAEAYAASDQMQKAIQFYQKALDVDPKYGNADFARKFLAEHRTAQ